MLVACHLGPRRFDGQPVFVFHAAAGDAQVNVALAVHDELLQGGVVLGIAGLFNLLYFLYPAPLIVAAVMLAVDEAGNP